MYTINLKKSTKTIKVNRVTNPIVVRQTTRPIVVRRVGTKGEGGERGVQGEPGLGMPKAGTTDQILVKQSNADYDFTWGNSAAADKSYSQAFNVADVVSVSHNLLKYPAVSVMDSAGDLVEGTVVYQSMNQLTVAFSAPFSGTVICN